MLHIGELAFDYIAGGCANVNNEKILLCFNLNWNGSSDADKCRSLPSPTGLFADIPSSNYKHRFTKIAASNSKFLI